LENIIMLDIMFHRETPSLHYDTTGDLEEISTLEKISTEIMV